MIIEHGIPKHNIFAIVVPPSYIKPTLDALEPDYVKPIHMFMDPKTRKTYEAEVQAIATLTVTQFISETIPSLLAYGVSSVEMAKYLQKRFPEILETQHLRYIVLKKL